MKAVMGAVVVAAGLCAAVMMRADEAVSPVVIGPVVSPLSRPDDRNAHLEYRPALNSGTEKINRVAGDPRSSSDLFSKFRNPVPSANDTTTAEANRPLQFPAVYAAIPALSAGAGDNSAVSFADQQTMTSDRTLEPSPVGGPNTEGNSPNILAAASNAPSDKQPSSAKSQASVWRPIQAVFKQFTGPIPSSSASGPIESKPNSTPNTSPIGGANPASESSSLTIEALPPWKLAPSEINSMRHPSSIVMGNPDASLPPGYGYVGDPPMPKSECGYCSPAPAFGCCTCQSVRQGGPGCNGGSNGTCANGGGTCGDGVGSAQHPEDGCGGGSPSTWVNGNGIPIAGTPAYGSCVLQRLACCLCAPYPDCSNGCVDFCHSWIFHEDCHWCTSNHKCCNPGCPESPHGGCANGTGGGCGCGCAQCVPPPDFYGTADAMILTRNNDATNQAVVVQSGTGDTLFSTPDMGFVYEVGPSITLGYRPTPWDAWEVSYFGLTDWDSRQSLAGAGDLNLPGALGAAAGMNFANADAMSIRYSSIIHNGEFNYLWTHGQIMWILGFRYFNLGENYDMTSTAAAGSSVYDLATRNDLYGGQIGARYRAGWKRFNWDVFGKAGVFGNRALQQQTVSNVGGATFRDTSIEHGNTAFVGDIGVNLTYSLSKCWSVRAGYNAIWVEDVALAPNQLDFTDTPTSGTTLNHNGSLFLHGAHAGFGCRW
ncbi:MAG: BBP7 family outer membrane beta-barrel protein [Pirellulales bacterium]|nr:BBP7 family outer membrane beta-barrel protein [Pirellulales bacterium]